MLHISVLILVPYCTMLYFQKQVLCFSPTLRDMQMKIQTYGYGYDF